MNFGKNSIIQQIEQLAEGRHQRRRHAVLSALRCFLLVLIVLACGVVSLGLGMVAAIIHNAPDLSSVSVAPSGYATTLYDRSGNVMRTLVQAGSNRKEISYSEMPENLVNAFIAIEDERFLTHNGVDIKGILRALFVGLSSGRFSEGASTITQQLIKNNVLGGGTETNWGDRISRKIQEQYLAIQLERSMPKTQIMEYYLNTINLGSNTLGVEAASNRYFNKHASELTLSECAVIAAITKNPSAYNPVTHPDKNAERRKTVLKRMLEQELITQAEYTEALEDDVYSRIQNVNSTYSSTAKAYTYFEDSVVESVIADLQSELGYTQTQAYNYLYSGGLKIHTTMDSDIQAVVNEEINDPSNYPYEKYSFTYTLRITDADGNVRTVNESSIRSYFQTQENAPAFQLLFDTTEEISEIIEQYKEAIVKPGDSLSDEHLEITLQPQVSMVILDNSTGQVLAINGGRGEKNASLSLNRATDSMRQPGSCFKVLAAFAPALDTYSATLATTYYDAPFSIDDKSFANWWGQDYVGYANIRQGIVYSMNIVAMKCMVNTVTPSVGYQYLKDFGFTTLVDGRQTEAGYFTDVVPALCLGGITDGVTNLEMTAAYATIANRGVYNEPVFYTRIEDRNGKVILEKESESRTVLKETTSLLLTYAMEETFEDKTSPWTECGIASPLGVGYGISNMSAAAKSGTTTNNHDVWFEGYSPYYTCGIWSGYDESASFDGGQVFHKQIWSKVMTRIHENLTDPGFPYSSDIVAVKICSTSGKLAVDDCCGLGEDAGQVYVEYFASGTEPTEYCDRHIRVNVCENSGYLATDYCPESAVRSHIYVVIDEKDLQENTDAVTALTPYTMPAELVDHYCDLHSEEFQKDIDETEAESDESTEDSDGNTPAPASISD